MILSGLQELLGGNDAPMTRIVREPIYQQLNQALRRLIRGGDFAVGNQFLTERQIAERFEVSRITANKALASLVSEGLLSFRKGVGTFVCAPPLAYDLRALASFTEKAAAAGLRPGTRVLRFARLPAGACPPEAPAALAEAGELFAIERLRLADEEPVILERRLVVARHCPDLDERDLAGSLYSLWADRYQLVITAAEQTIRAVALDNHDATLLGVARGAAALELECLGRLQHGLPLWWERTRYRGDRYAFAARPGAEAPVAGLPYRPAAAPPSPA